MLFNTLGAILFWVYVFPWILIVKPLPKQGDFIYQPTCVKILLSKKRLVFSGFIRSKNIFPQSPRSLEDYG